MTGQKKCDVTYGQTDRQTDRRTDGRTDGQTDDGEVIPKCHLCLQQVTQLLKILPFRKLYKSAMLSEKLKMYFINIYYSYSLFYNYKAALKISPTLNFSLSIDL